MSHPHFLLRQALLARQFAMARGAFPVRNADGKPFPPQTEGYSACEAALSAPKKGKSDRPVSPEPHPQAGSPAFTAVPPSSSGPFPPTAPPESQASPPSFVPEDESDAPRRRVVPQNLGSHSLYISLMRSHDRMGTRHLGQ